MSFKLPEPDYDFNIVILKKKVVVKPKITWFFFRL